MIWNFRGLEELGYHGVCFVRQGILMGGAIHKEEGVWAWGGVGGMDCGLEYLTITSVPKSLFFVTTLGDFLPCGFGTTI